MEIETQPLSFEVRHRKATVLVVDDSPEIRRYLTMALELDQYHVETAASGEEAAQRLRDGCNAVIALLDLQMTGMDGLQTLRQFRELRPELKVIMCSAVDDPIIMQEAAQLGADAYLVKPIRHLYLSAAVDRCLREHYADASARGLNPAVLAPVPTPLRPN